MSLPNAVFSWAASRSGLGMGDFIASLTPEREEQLLRAYNEWAAEKGLKTVHFSSPKPMPTSVTKRQPTPQPTPAPVSEQQDELVDQMEAVASEIDDEEVLEATELATTIAEIEAINVPPDDTPIPEDVEEEIKEDAAPVSTPVSPVPVSPVLDDRPCGEADAAPILDEQMGGLADAADDQTDDDVDAADAMAQLPIEQRIDKLPKDASRAIYEGILASMASDVDTLKAVTEAVIRNHTRRHRGTAPQRAFLAWLEERNSPQPE